MARQRFQPHTMEVTRELEISGLDDHEAERLKKELLSETATDDPVLRTTLAALEQPAWTQVRWKKWRDWGQYTSGPNPPGASESGTTGAAVPRKTQELTTHYQIEPADADASEEKRS